jgi:hypothetical protein
VGATCWAEPASTVGGAATKQHEWLNPRAGRKPLETLERQIALASLNPTHVRAVNTEDVSKCLLAQPEGLAVGT